MAFRVLKLLRRSCIASAFRQNTTTSKGLINQDLPKSKRVAFKTEDKLVYMQDPDTFGTLSRRVQNYKHEEEDEGDVKEEKYLENKPLPSQKLSIKQYADLIKQHLKYKRIKEAIDVVEVRMLTEDRVKPENYIYNILIGACADVGYTHKAFKLFNDMKRRALSPTGDTYTCLFEACANSPWPEDGIKRANHLRSQMQEKGIEPNLTNYNAMIKTFGRCGDLKTAFQIVDEMASKKIKIRVHTYNHLLHACISDKESGLRHALIVWRKMLQRREKPNIYSFNLMLKCVKECSLGTKEDIEELISIIQAHMPVAINMKEENKISLIEPSNEAQISSLQNEELLQLTGTTELGNQKSDPDNTLDLSTTKDTDITLQSSEINQLVKLDHNEAVEIQLVDKTKLVPYVEPERTVPNLLSKNINMRQVLSLQEVHSIQDKFAVIGGQEDFLKEMAVYSVKPDIKTFTQMLAVIDENKDAENKLLEAISASEVKTDIDFYNMLIKKRCLRSDYDGAFEVKTLIKKESEFRKKRYPMNKKLKLNVDIMTYGTLAMACDTKDKAEKLLKDMAENHLRVNIQILGTMLRQGTAHNQLSYVFYILNVVKDENVKVNDVFIRHLESFSDKCIKFIQEVQEGRQYKSEVFILGCKSFLKFYKQWLTDVNVEEALKPEHPWSQFRENYPETLQRQNIDIVEPKRYYRKRNKKYVPYIPRI